MVNLNDSLWVSRQHWWMCIVYFYLLVSDTNIFIWGNFLLRCFIFILLLICVYEIPSVTVNFNLLADSPQLRQLWQTINKIILLLMIHLHIQKKKKKSKHKTCSLHYTFLWYFHSRQDMCQGLEWLYSGASQTAVQAAGQMWRCGGVGEASFALESPTWSGSPGQEGQQ